MVERSITGEVSLVSQKILLSAGQFPLKKFPGSPALSPKDESATTAPLHNVGEPI